MSISRRTFVLGSLTTPIWLSSARAAGPNDCTLPSTGTPTRLIPNESTVLPRPSAVDLANAAAATQLSQFRAAIDVVRHRGDDDVTGWQKQIAQHCLNCTRSNPNNIHFNWSFLPWHRALLYLLERNLRKIGPDSIRLPYWGWEEASGRTLPAIYAAPNQSLLWGNRNTSGPDWPLSDGDVDVQPLLVGTKSFDDFGGTVTPKKPVPVTYSGPHANVHNAFSPGDMSDLMYSPRDPVFYAHHANIDRLWSSWVAAGHANPDFGDARVNFFDEDKQWRYILLNDLRDEKALGYRYDSLMKPKVPISALTHFHFAPAGAHLFSLAESERPQFHPTGPGPGPDFLIIRNIENVSQFAKTDLRFGIFTRALKQGIPGRTNKTFLGELSRVQSQEHDHAGPISAALDVSGRIANALETDKNSLSLFIAPLDAAGRTSAAAVPLIAQSLSLVR